MRTGKTVVVTGGAGFLGSHLCQGLIEDGHRVVCVDNLQTGSRENLRAFADRSGFSLIEHDICKPLDLSGPVDEIYNLACAASPVHYQADPVHTLMTSVLGTKHLLDLARAKGARFLQASTSEVYGDPEEHPQQESYWGHVNPIGLRACYDEGKRAAETLCFDYLRAGRVDVRVMRIFNTYGPRMQSDDGRIVSNLITQAVAGRPLTIYGTGEQTRSFCYVSDLIRGMRGLMAVEPNPGEPVNIGNTGEFTINELARLVLDITGSRSRIVYETLPADDPQRRRPDIARAGALLGWAPTVPLEEGLPPTIAWFSRSREASARPVPAGTLSVADAG